ncbi:MAG: hypothetical protein ACI4ET_12995 [Bilifractor sp.]
MDSVGAMTMPAGFKHKRAYLKGRPRHAKYSDFRIRHPQMDHTHRAKIFLAFDALKGFDEAIDSKEIQYVPRKRLPEEELNRIITSALPGQKTSVTYFSPCTDPANDAFEEHLGIYKTITGTVWKIDPVTETLMVDETVIRFEDIAEIG